jgi:DNA invertase Pin-like site-specific DNA recombinase
MLNNNLSNTAATHQPSDTRAALYCRAARDNDHAIKEQKMWLSRYARKIGYKNPKWYIDNGEDGRTLERPAMNALMEDIKSGVVNAVAVTSVDRISRGFSDLAEWMRFCNVHNVRYISVESGEFNELATKKL